MPKIGSGIDVYLKEILSASLVELAAEEGKTLPDESKMSQALEIERPKREGQGDRATSAALRLSKSFGISPRDLASKIIAALEGKKGGLIEKIEVAGPGFINFFLSGEWLSNVVHEVLSEGDRYGANDAGAGRRVQVEFVSANPTGPLHIGHGRGAAVGDTLANLLAFAGWKVEREYYINDAGLQMEILGRSTQSRYFELQGKPDLAPFPENAYKGGYIYDIAKSAIAEEGDKFLSMPLDESLPWFKKLAGGVILGTIKADLEDFGVHFDVWFSESTLYERKLVPQAMEYLKTRGYTFESEGALWFKTSDFAEAPAGENSDNNQQTEEEKDRVLIRGNGVPTYFASDIAYHKEKFDRGFDRVIDIWGADHHGYVPRMKAGIEAIGRNPSDFDVMLIQFVNLVRDGVQVPMSTRSGQFVTLRDVLDEVGVDATRYFFLMRRHDSQLDFDLELAKKAGNDNPVYYVQYAHARISSVLREAVAQGKRLPEANGDISPAIFPVIFNEAQGGAEARKLVDFLAFFPKDMAGAARDLTPHAVTVYATGLAGAFHAFYNTNRILDSTPDLEASRLALALAAKIVLARCLAIIGVSAPEKM
ncbi:arginine--tRNA ligase [Synergistales bacterium]|nr:arginine--tRNA ligase [Synergistales bacterium]